MVYLDCYWFRVTCYRLAPGLLTRNSEHGTRNLSIYYFFLLHTAFCLTLLLFPTIHHMIIHHPRRLHERITDRRSCESESPFLQIPAHCIRLTGPRGDLF